MGRRFTPAMGAKVNMARSPISGGRPRRFVRNARRSVRRQVRAAIGAAEGPPLIIQRKYSDPCSRPTHPIGVLPKMIAYRFCFNHR